MFHINHGLAWAKCLGFFYLKILCLWYLNCEPHRDFYDTIESYLEDEVEGDEIDKDVLSEIIKRDSLIIIMAYPDSPIGSYACYHYDLEKCVDEMINTIKK